MQNLDKIHDYILESNMILIMNNNSQLLLNALMNKIYNKYPLKKRQIRTGKGLYKKLIDVKDKLVKINIRLSKIQLGSSTNKNKIYYDFKILQACVVENKSKLLFYETKEFNYHFRKNPYYNMPLYNVFDLIIMIDKNDIKIIKYRNGSDKEKFDIKPLLRSTKLRQLNLFS